MGYNLEESLPLLIQFSVHAQDAQSLQFYAARMRDHLAFLLPDGAIDNSFGTRHNKWTYWGSRTSDGALEGLAHLAPLDPLFARAADAVLGLYAVSYTHLGRASATVSFCMSSSKSRPFAASKSSVSYMRPASGRITTMPSDSCA